MLQDQGCTIFSLLPETNPRQGGLHTEPSQTSMFWSLAAAEGYLPASQRSLSSQHTLILHYLGTAAKQNGVGIVLTHAFMSLV